MSQRIICGIHPVRRALLVRPQDVHRVYVRADLGAERQKRLAPFLGRAREITSCSVEQLDALTGSARHQGVAAEISGGNLLTEHEARALLEQLDTPLVLALDSVQDPRNFGACLRAADGAGADLVVVARGRNVDLTSVVSKVAAGAAETLALAQAANLVRFLESIKVLGIWIVGADATAPKSLYEGDFRAGTALVLGGEGEGLRRLTRETCDYLVSLPMAGSVESLNVAVAAGVCLYEVVRQRQLLPGASFP